PSVEDARIEIVGQDARAEVGVRHDATEIAPTGLTVLCRWVQQVAVGHPVVVRIGPCPYDAGRAKRRSGLWHPQGGILAGVVARTTDALQVLADVHLDRSPGGPEQVVRKAHPRGDVPVAVDPRRLRD